MKRNIVLLMLVMIMIVLTSGIALAQHDDAAATQETSNGLRYLAAGIAVGLSAIATGIAQSRIGAAGMGSIVEKPESTGTVIICLAIPETMVILGFVVAAMIIIL